MKRKKKKVEFTSYEKMVFGLYSETDFSTPEAHVLRKVLDIFPWITDVANCEFDQEVTKAGALVCLSRCEMVRAYNNYHRKRKKK